MFVTGGSLLQGALNVSGASHFNAGVTAGALFVTGGSLLQGALNVSGATLFDSSLTVTGASVFNAGVTAGALNVTGASILQVGVTAGVLNVTGESTLYGNVTMGSNAVVVGPAFQIPIGNIAARPATPQDGYVRYNNETQQFEGYGPGSAWGSLGGVIDIAQTTKVLASASPSVTDGNLYFYTVGDERMRINSAGNIGVHTTAPNYTLDVIGTFGVSGGLTSGSLNVTGETLLHGAVTAGALNVTGNSILQGFVTAGALTVTGESFLRGAVTAGALAVTGASLLQGGLTAGTLHVTGASLLNGSVQMMDTANSSGVGTGGSLTVFGGSSISKDLHVGNSLYSNSVNMTPSLGDIASELSFGASNNVSSSTSITSFSFSNALVRSFQAMVSVIITRSAGGNLYANFDLKGLQKESSWVLNTTYIGDFTGISFSIDSNGQIQYTSSNQANWLSTTMKFRGLTTSN